MSIVIQSRRSCGKFLSQKKNDNEIHVLLDNQICHLCTKSFYLDNDSSFDIDIETRKPFAYLILKNKGEK